MTPPNPLEYESPRDRTDRESPTADRSRRLGTISCALAGVAMVLIVGGVGLASFRGDVTGALALIAVLVAWAAFIGGFLVGIAADASAGRRCWQAVVGLSVNFLGAAAPIVIMVIAADW